MNRFEMNKHQLLKIVKIGLVMLLVFLVIMAGVGFFVGKQHLFAAIKGLTRHFVVTTLLLVALYHVIKSLRWIIIVKRLSIKVPIPGLVMSYFSGYAGIPTPLHLGESLRLWLLNNKYKYPYAKLSEVFFLEKLADIHTFLICILLAIGELSHYYLLTITMIALCLAVTWLVAKPQLCIYFLEKISQKLPKTATTTAAISLSLHNCANIMTSIWYYIILAVNIGYQLILILILYVIAHQFSLHISFFIAIFIYILSEIIGTLSFIPAGIGVVEGAMAGLLILKGFPADASLMVTLIFRFIFVWVTFAIGLIFLPLSLKMIKPVAAPDTDSKTNKDGVDIVRQIHKD